MEIKIIQAQNQEDFKICDGFLSKLIAYESTLDCVINKDVLVSGPAESNAKQNDVFIAYAKTEEPVGFILGYRQFAKGKIYNKDILILEALYVEPNVRKRGVGKKLLLAFEEWAKQKYAEHIIEITHIHSNENAKSFYEKMGYSTSKITLRK